MIKEAPGNNWYEDEFPPKGDMAKGRYSGYNTWNECILFHEFAVNLYDMWFSYKGRKYFFNNSGDDGVQWVSEDWRETYGEWANPVEFIKNFELDGRKLFEVVNELDEIDWI